MNKRPKVPKDEKVVLSPVGEKVLCIIKYYGTNIYGEEYKRKQQARAIEQLFSELDEGSTMLRDFKFVKVVPK